MQHHQLEASNAETLQQLQWKQAADAFPKNIDSHPGLIITPAILLF
jgi:hypothetical protein